MALANFLPRLSVLINVCASDFDVILPPLTAYLEPLSVNTWVIVLIFIGKQADFAYFKGMNKTVVLYNGNSLLCSYEMGTYCKYAREHDLDLSFHDLHTVDLSLWGMTKEQAMRSLHVMYDGEVQSGIDAFVTLWLKMPRYRVWGKFVSLPGMRELSSGFFNWVVMPILYRTTKDRTQKIGFETFA